MMVTQSVSAETGNGLLQRLKAEIALNAYYIGLYVFLYGIAIVSLWESIANALDARSHFNLIFDEALNPTHALSAYAILFLMVWAALWFSLPPILRLLGRKLTNLPVVGRVGEWMARIPDFPFPRGIYLAIAAVPFLAVAFGADLILHTIFGIEHNFEATVGTAHIPLMFAISMLHLGLIVTCIYLKRTGKRVPLAALFVGLGSLAGFWIGLLGEWLSPLTWDLMTGKAPVSDPFVQEIFQQFTFGEFAFQTVAVIGLFLFMIKYYGRVEPLGFLFMMVMIYVVGGSRYYDLKFALPWVAGGVFLELIQGWVINNLFLVHNSTTRLGAFLHSPLFVRFALCIGFAVVAWGTYLLVGGGTWFTPQLMVGLMFFTGVPVMLFTYMAVGPKFKDITPAFPA